MVEKEVKTDAPKPKRKKLSKSIEGSILTITEGNTEQSLTFDFNSLPDSIKELFGPFGMSHKLGDAAAGKRGQEALDAINKVWEGLLAGNWTVRAPAAEKITKASIKGKFEAMPDGKEKVLAQELLKKLGIAI